DFRGQGTRLAALPVLEGLRHREPGPLILAGDFNSAPPGWAGAEGRTVLGELLEAGWRSPRISRPPSPREWTFPLPEPDRALDWILVEPPLRVLEARVLRPGRDLSDHAPVVSTVEIPEEEPGPTPGSRSGAGTVP
ncbi:MAG: endonuclease/exonuclease/phosphatase family protein, partial [Thermoanaerobaculia bacterium]|nr:endonuclease/exonuclease/phosphatase family protein [Thermoanaerobaculia bacterium]